MCSFVNSNKFADRLKNLKMEDRNGLREAFFFSAITLGLSFLVFWGPLAFLQIPAISFVRGVRGPLWAVVLFLLGGFAPTVVAIVFTGIFEGKTGLRSLFRRAVQFRIGFRWYGAIVLIVFLGTAGKLVVHSLCGGRFDFSLFLVQLPSFVPLLVAGPISEEFGWRGYLLSKLQQRWSALHSSMFVGLVWGFWHLPLFYIVGTSQHELHLPFIGFLVSLVAVSIIMTWLNNNTSGSIWTAVLFHWLHTYSSQVVSTGVTRSTAYDWLEYSPYILLALIVVLIWKPGKKPVQE